LDLGNAQQMQSIRVIGPGAQNLDVQESRLLGQPLVVQGDRAPQLCVESTVHSILRFVHGRRRLRWNRPGRVRNPGDGMMNAGAMENPI
jgi:hypothetical protein